MSTPTFLGSKSRPCGATTARKVELLFYAQCERKNWSKADVPAPAGQDDATGSADGGIDVRMRGLRISPESARADKGRLLKSEIESDLGFEVLDGIIFDNRHAPPRGIGFCCQRACDRCWRQTEGRAVRFNRGPRGRSSRESQGSDKASGTSDLDAPG